MHTFGTARHASARALGSHAVVIVMAPKASETDIAGVVSHIEAHGGQAFVSRGVMRTIVGVVGSEEVLETLDADGLPGVAETMRITAPYKLVSAQNHARRTTVRVGGVPIGPETFTLIAGPCAVESASQTLEAARMAKRAGATLLRGGAYKPRTSPYAFQGLGLTGLRILAEVREEVQLPIVTEVTDVGEVDVVAELADMLQVGARNMQNFALLKKLARTRKPILLKRGPSATVKEWLSAAEYLLHGGNENVVLCERGIKTFDNSLRNTLDLAGVALVKEMTHLPIIVDPSHATGKRSIIPACARAALAVGADGVIVEVHPEPEKAWSDGAQSLTFENFAELMNGLRVPMKSVTSTVPALVM